MKNPPLNECRICESKNLEKYLNLGEQPFSNSFLKYNEIKKRITASAKFVDFGKNSGESIFEINNDMSLEEKIKILVRKSR